MPNATWSDVPGTSLTFTTRQASPTLDLDVSGVFSVLVAGYAGNPSCFLRVLVDGALIPTSDPAYGDLAVPLAATAGPGSWVPFSLIRRAKPATTAGNTHLVKLQVMGSANTSNRCGISGSGTDAARVRVTER
jgi:hypothetical protein